MTHLIWSTDLQKFRHHVFMPVATTIDQPQLTLPILEAEHMENLACERQLSQAIHLRFLHGTEFSPLQPQQHGLQIPASSRPSRGTQKRQLHILTKSPVFENIGQTRRCPSTSPSHPSGPPMPPQHRDLDHLPQMTRSRKREKHPHAEPPPLELRNNKKVASRTGTISPREARKLYKDFPLHGDRGDDLATSGSSG